MASWIRCPCGGLIHTNLCCGANVRLVISDTELDDMPEQADERGVAWQVMSRSGRLYTCRHCRRIAIEDRDLNITFYSQDS